MKYLILSLSFFFYSCDFFEEPSQKNYAHLYVDILIAEETHKTDVDSLQIVLDSLYKTYNTSESNYLLELEKFSYNKETWDEFFGLTEEYLDTLKAIEKRERK